MSAARLNGSATGRSRVLGDATAEGDRVRLDLAFVETADYRTLIETHDRTLVIGRRGTGKSALYYKLHKHWKGQKQTRVVSFAPEDYDVIAFRGLLTAWANEFNKVRAVTRVLWRYGFCMEILSAVRHTYKVSDEFEAPRSEIDLWFKGSGDLLQKLRDTVHRTMRARPLNDAFIGDLSRLLRIGDLEQFTETVLAKTGLNVAVLLDRLDEGYEPDTLGIGVVAGISTAAIELAKRFANVRPIVFLRDNIFRALAKLDPDYSRNIEGQELRLHWGEQELLTLVANRLRLAFELTPEKSQRIWDACTANELRGPTGFRTCLQFTLYRPRDLLSLLNEAFFHAAKERRAQIVLEDLESTARDISRNRLDDLVKEYRRTFPSIGAATRLFANSNPELRHPELVSRLSALSPEALLKEEEPGAAEDVVLLGPGRID